MIHRNWKGFLTSHFKSRWTFKSICFKTKMKIQTILLSLREVFQMKNLSFSKVSLKWKGYLITWNFKILSSFLLNKKEIKGKLHFLLRWRIYFTWVSSLMKIWDICKTQRHLSQLHDFLCLKRRWQFGIMNEMGWRNLWSMWVRISSPFYSQNLNLSMRTSLWINSTQRTSISDIASTKIPAIFLRNLMKALKSMWKTWVNLNEIQKECYF